MNHTPGDWREDSTMQGRLTAFFARESSVIAEEDAHMLAAVLCKEFPEVDSALDLLQALRLCVIDAQQELTKKERLNRLESAKAAIAKAEGR